MGVIKKSKCYVIVLFSIGCIINFLSINCFAKLSSQSFELGGCGYAFNNCSESERINIYDAYGVLVGCRNHGFIGILISPVFGPPYH
jgi:hypothetical protein